MLGSSTSSQNSGDAAGIGSTGLNLLNLRNLGTQRTLVLVDGRRHVAGVPGEQSVDINTIPQDLIEGIDILTGGASAVYGADGVSGVVNFRLKQNFEGLTARAQAGISQRGDAGERLITVTGGVNFAEGRGNVALSYEYGADDRLDARDRKYLNEGRRVFVLNPDNPDNDPSLPTRVPLTDARYGLSSPAGAVDLDGDYVPEFVGTGDIFDNGLDLGEGYVQGGSSVRVADYANDLRPRIRRNIVNGLGHFDVSPAFTLFAEAKYARISSFSLAQPTFDYGIFVPEDNPYIPDAIRAAINPDVGGVFINRDNFDLGQRGEDILRQTYRGVIGARGDVSDSLHYEVSYTYGKTKVRSRYLGDIYNDRFFAAVDAVRDPASGQITCRANIDPEWTPNQPLAARTVLPITTFTAGQCSPINLFGIGQSNPAGVAFITAPTTDRSSVEQQVLTGSIAGDFRQLFSLPGGPVSFVLGGEYRREKSSFNPDVIEQQGLTYTNVLLPTRGKFNVKEAFAELEAPILKDRPFFQTLTVGAALRYSDYSTIGHTTTWKVDGIYAPIRDVSFRGTYSVAIRAPNIGELFGGQSQTFEFFDDPCLPQNIQNGTQYRAANCQTLLTGLGADPATYADSRSTNIPGTSGGNAGLTEEKAKTWTAGVVLAPRFLPGLTVSADWYNIKLTNAINTVEAQQLSELCVDQPNLDNQFCSAIVRQNGPATGLIEAGNIIGFSKGPQNVAAFRTSGLDVNANYRLQTRSLGAFNIKAVAGYLDTLNFVGTPGADPTDDRGTSYSPKYQANLDLTWSLDGVTLNYGLSWFDKTLRYSKLINAGTPLYVDPKYKYFKERWVHDIYVSFDATDRMQFYMGVNNLFDQRPSIGASRYPTEATGRFFFAGARVKIDKIL